MLVFCELDGCFLDFVRHFEYFTREKGKILNIVENLPVLPKIRTALDAEIETQDEQSPNLSDERFRGSYSDFYPGTSKESLVGEPGNGRPRDVDDAKSFCLMFLEVFERFDGIGGFPRLRNEHKEGRRHDTWRPAEKFARDGYPGVEIREFLDPIRSEKSRMVGGSAGDEFHSVEFGFPKAAKRIGRNNTFLELNSATKNIREDIRGFIDFFEHEMRILADIDMGLGNIDFFLHTMNHNSCVFDGGFSILDMHDITIFEVDDIGGVHRDTVDVRCEEKVIVLALGKNERTSEFDPNHFCWVLVVDEHDSVGSFQSSHEFFYPFEKRFSRDSSEKFRDDFGIGVAIKCRVFDFLDEFAVVLYDAVVDDKSGFFLVGVGMGVSEVDDPVGGPSGVADATRVVFVSGFGILDETRELGDLSNSFVDVDTSTAVDGNSSRVVAPVFEVF